MKRVASSLAIFDSPLTLPGVLVVGLVLRLLLLSVLAEVPPQSDAASYVQMSLQLLRGESFEPYYPPGLSFLMVPAHSIFGPASVVARASMLAIWAATSLFLWAHARSIGGARAASLALAGCALYPTAIWLSVEPLTQMSTAACLLAIAWLTPELVTRPRVLLGVALGLATGELALTRPSALPFVVAVPLYLLVRGAGARIAGVTFAAASVCVGAWLAHAHAMTGRFVAVNDANALNLFIGNNRYTPLYKTWWFGSHFAGESGVPEAYTALEQEIAAQPPAERQRRYGAEALRHIVARPDLFLLRTVNRVCVYFALDSAMAAWARDQGLVGTPGTIALMGVEAAFYLAVIVGACFACVAPTSDSRGRERLLLTAGVGLLYALPYFVGFSHPTYHFPLVLLGLSLAASFVDRAVREPAPGPLAQIWAAPRLRRLLLTVVAALVLVQIEWVAMNVARL